MQSGSVPPPEGAIPEGESTDPAQANNDSEKPAEGTPEPGTLPVNRGNDGNEGQQVASVPEDIGPGNNDDIVAQQLREAAMAETDPELREKLWEEYRRYKAGAISEESDAQFHPNGHRVRFRAHAGDFLHVNDGGQCQLDASAAIARLHATRTAPRHRYPAVRSGYSRQSGGDRRQDDRAGRPPQTESRYIAYQLKDTLELTGNWGAVRVTPESSKAVDLDIRGEILLSDGESLRARVKAVDSRGVTWINKVYEDNASKYSYEQPKEDPFQDFYNQIADDLLAMRERLSKDQLSTIRQISRLQYASSLSEAAFGEYLDESGRRVRINKLPAEDNAMMERVDRIKQREYLFVDTLDDYYGKFYREMKPSYDEWRFATYDEAIRLRQMKKQATNRLLGGAAMIAGGLYAGNKSGTYAGQTASVGAVMGGIGSIKSGLDRRKEAEIHEESLREMSQSLGSEIAPFVLDIEGRTIELTGTADAQYEKWRRLLKEIYAEETGFPVD
ncbi:MAG: hypothetical protein U5O39_07720 [Gammaproteobacteria bacterium]|nr:hypothetical protein [Gammaproteobacteria bacterium]